MSWCLATYSFSYIPHGAHIELVPILSQQIFMFLEICFNWSLLSEREQWSWNRFPIVSNIHWVKNWYKNGHCNTKLPSFYSMSLHNNKPLAKKYDGPQWTISHLCVLPREFLIDRLGWFVWMRACQYGTADGHVLIGPSVPRKLIWMEMNTILHVVVSLE
jgi:hypothetical protein